MTRLGAVNHPAFSPVHFAVSGQHQFASGDKGFGNVAPSGVL